MDADELNALIESRTDRIFDVLDRSGLNLTSAQRMTVNFAALSSFILSSPNIPEGYKDLILGYERKAGGESLQNIKELWKIFRKKFKANDPTMNEKEMDLWCRVAEDVGKDMMFAATRRFAQAGLDKGYAPIPLYLAGLCEVACMLDASDTKEPTFGPVCEGLLEHLKVMKSRFPAAA